MDLRQRWTPTAEQRQRAQVTADAERHIRLSLTAVRERLRVTRLRAADRQRLAENAAAAGQAGFEARLRDAADAHVATTRALEETMIYLERCWSRIEDQRRVRARTAMALRATTASAEGGVDPDWRNDD